MCAAFNVSLMKRCDRWRRGAFVVMRWRRRWGYRCAETYWSVVGKWSGLAWKLGCSSRNALMLSALHHLQPLSPSLPPSFSSFDIADCALLAFKEVTKRTMLRDCRVLTLGVFFLGLTTFRGLNPGKTWFLREGYKLSWTYTSASEHKFRIVIETSEWHMLTVHTVPPFFFQWFPTSWALTNNLCRLM